MAVELFEFDVEALHSLNADILKYFEDMYMNIDDTMDLCPREKELLIKAGTAYEEGRYDLAMSLYKGYLYDSTKQQTSDNIRHLEIVIQYLVANCLLHSSHFNELVEGRKKLNELEADGEKKYPMVFYALAKFYTKVYCFEEAERYITKCFAILHDIGEHATFPECFIPETTTHIPESIPQELKVKLLKLKEQCLGRPLPNAKCYMDNCAEISPNHICGKNIFLKSPAFHGMVTLICNNVWNPCAIAFHSACWKVMKDKISSPMKLNDKEILLNWICLTPNCESNNTPSLITQILIRKSDGTIKTIDPSPEKSNWMPHQANVGSKGAIRKHKHVSKRNTTTRTTKPTSKKTNDNYSNDDVYFMDGNNNACDNEKSPTLCDQLTSKIPKMADLRLLNVNIDNDWKPNEAYNRNECMRTMLRKSYESYISRDLEHITYLKSCLLLHFFSYIEENGPLKNEELMKEWKYVTDTGMFSPITDQLTDIIYIREFLLESCIFLAIEDYICVPSTSPGAYTSVAENVCLKATEMFERDIVKEEDVMGDIKNITAPSRQLEPLDDATFLLTPEDFMNASQSSQFDNEDFESESECQNEAAIEEIIDSDSTKTDKNELMQIEDQKEETTEGHQSIEIDCSSNDLPESCNEDLVKKINPCELGNDSKNTINIAGNVSDESEHIVTKPEINCSLGECNNELKPYSYLQRFADSNSAEGPCVEQQKNQQESIFERNVIESESDDTSMGQRPLPNDSMNSSESPNNNSGCLRCQKCRCDELQELKNEIDMFDERHTKIDDKLNQIKAMVKSKEKYYKKKILKIMQNSLRYQYNTSEALISSKIQSIQSECDTVTRVQNMVHDITNNVLEVDQSNWQNLIEKLEMIRLSYYQESKNLMRLIILKKNAEDNHIDVDIRFNRLKLPYITQRDVPAVVENAFDMVKNHYQQLTPQYTYSHAMMSNTNQIQQLANFPTRLLQQLRLETLFTNSILLKQSYKLPNQSTPMTISQYPCVSNNMNDSCSGFNSKPLSTGKWLTPIPPEESQAIFTHNTDSLKLISPDIQTVQAEVKPSPPQIYDRVKITEGGRALRQHPILRRAAKLRKPFKRTQAEVTENAGNTVTTISPTTLKTTITSEVEPASTNLIKDGFVDSVNSSVAQFHSDSSVNNKQSHLLNESKGASSMIDNGKLQETTEASELNGCEKRKMNSIDKLMVILRHKYPHALEYDLLWSVEIARTKHQNSLSGLSLAEIVEDVNTLIKMRQKLQIIGYRT